MLALIVFSSGFITMAFELVGARMLWPYYGTSIFVWSSIIGIILAAIAFGYILGGRWADRGANIQGISSILLLSTIAMSVTLMIHAPILDMLTTWTRDARIGSILASIILFAPTSIFLGMIPPYTTRLRITEISSSGKHIGHLGAINTLGSIAGTFATGFLLLPSFGIRILLVFLSLSLFFLSCLIAFRHAIIARILALGCIMLSIFLLYTQKSDASIREFDTSYSHIRIIDFLDPETHEPMRTMQINVENHSTRSLKSDRLINRYTEFYHLARHFVPDMKHALMLGGAGYSFPQSFLSTYPHAEIDVVEIDPDVTTLARAYFWLTDHPRLHIIHEDGRVFLNHTRKQYDVIFWDAFTSWYSVPYQLTTQEAVSRQYDRLTENGALILNVVSSLEGETSDFFRAEYHTLASIFPKVAVFPVQTPHDTHRVQNIILVALKNPHHAVWQSPDPFIETMLAHRYHEITPETAPILTDDYAPVERMVEKFLP